MNTNKGQRDRVHFAKSPRHRGTCQRRSFSPDVPAGKQHNLHTKLFALQPFRLHTSTVPLMRKSEPTCTSRASYTRWAMFPPTAVHVQRQSVAATSQVPAQKPTGCLLCPLANVASASPRVHAAASRMPTATGPHGNTHTHIHVRKRISPQRSHTGQVWQARIPACGSLPPPQRACVRACVPRCVACCEGQNKIK